MSTKTNTIAFFGATGGCANACLTHVLKSSDNLHAIALARTPSKLLAQLQGQGVSQEILDTRLRIVQGDATNIADIKATIVLEDTTENSVRKVKLVDTIIGGVGSTPTLTTKGSFIPSFSLQNPSITEEFSRALLAALQDASPFAENKPLIGVISTTGLTEKGMPDDVPWLLKPLYHVALKVPHEDKKKMEDILSQQTTGLIKGLVIVKPTLLSGDQNITSGKGWDKVKVGVQKKPAVGYSIARADVGEWLFQEVVVRGGEKWIGEKVTLTN